MCTVTVMSWPLQVARVVMNRDESRRRPPALPPQVVRTDAYVALYPTDPVAGGTWIAVTDAGLVFTLMNRTSVMTSNMTPCPLGPDHDRSATPPPPRARLSRGLVIPHLLPCRTLTAAVAQARQLPMRDYGLCRLQIIDRAGAGVGLISDGEHLVMERTWSTGEGVLFSSSGWGDAWVEEPRRQRFLQMEHATPWTPARQDEFHAWHWADHPECGTLMRRPDARTVSRTIVELRSTPAPGVGPGSGGALMHYTALDDAGQPAGPATVTELPWA